MNTLAALQPALVWKHFENLCAIPRMSKHEDGAIAYVEKFAKEKTLRYYRDPAGNVVIWKGATPGMEIHRTVVLQSHLDMVVQWRSGTSHDPLRDPIRPRIDGEWVKGTDTTLGADNGIGAAIALALLEDETIAHGPLEALFTIDEEAGMTGAFALAPEVLKGTILINFDTENEGELCIGCAGGLDAYITVPLVKEAAAPGAKFLEIRVGGLLGGHSGIDINLGRGNAIKLLNRLLYALAKNHAIRIAALSAGSARNAIPRDASAVIACPAEVCDPIRATAKEFESIYKAELSIADPGVQVVVLDAPPAPEVLDKNTQSSLLQSIYACPNGSMRMSDVAPGVVETSTNLATVHFDDLKAELQCLLRSSVDSAKIDLGNMVESAFSPACAKVVLTGEYPGWQPVPSSEIVTVMRATYEKMFGRPVELKVVHAGLECSIIGAKYPGMELVSCGPSIRFPHSPDEQLHIGSVGKFWRFIVEVLKNIPAGDQGSEDPA